MLGHILFEPIGHCGELALLCFPPFVITALGVALTVQLMYSLVVFTVPVVATLGILYWVLVGLAAKKLARDQFAPQFTARQNAKMAKLRFLACVRIVAASLAVNVVILVTFHYAGLATS